MRSNVTPRVFVLFLFVFVLLAGCSSGGESGTTTPTDGPDVTVPLQQPEDTGEPEEAASSGEALPATGRILVSSSPITGHQGHVLLVFGPNNESEICAPIDGDPWTLEETALTVRTADADPCTGSISDAQFGTGEHAVTASIFVPGSRDPVASTAALVDVRDGDGRLEVDGSKLSEATTGDPGRITVTVSEITGRAGKVLIVLGQNNAGSLCAMIDADPWVLPGPATLQELPGDDGGPCGEGTPEVVFPAGDTKVTAVVVIPGNPSAEATLETIITVDGDSTVAIDGAQLSG